VTASRSRADPIRVAAETTVHVREDPAQLTAGELAAWRAMAGDAGLPYATPEWMLAFWTHMHAPTGARLRIMVVRDGDGVAGIGPFYAERRPLGVTEYRLLGSGIGQRTAPLARPGTHADVAAALAHALHAERPTPGLLHLDAFDAASQWPGLLTGGWPGRVRPKMRELRRETALVATLDDDFDAWFAARSRRFRERARRRRRQVEQRGGVVRRSRTANELRSDLAALYDLHHEWFAAHHRRTSLNDLYQAAVMEASLGLLERDAARLWVVEADEGIVGAQISVHTGDRLCGWSGGMAPAWHDVSVGFVLAVEAVRDAHELGARYLDFGAGDLEYKRRLADADAPIAWSTIIVRDARYLYTRARLAPEHASIAARRAAKSLAATMAPE
jgi:CelD/BcsL family acetyltransferase involved in cellulose biosynthesis